MTTEKMIIERMTTQSRLSALLVEMVGSAAICGMAYAADRLMGAARRRPSPA